MTTWVVTRHTGSRQWLQQQGIVADHTVSELDIDVPEAGDIIIGILPIHHVATLNARGVRYLHLIVMAPGYLRGQELSSTDIDHFSAHLQEYRVQTVYTTTPVEQTITEQEQ